MDVLAASMLTVLQPSSNREAVRAEARWDGVDKDPDKFVQVTDTLTVKW